MLARIMVPLDTSALAERALPTAAALAKANDAELRLVLVHTPEPYSGYPDAPWNGARLAMEGAYLDGKAAELAREYEIVVVTEHPSGAVVPTLAASAREHRVDLIVLSTHGRTGVSRAWLGSVADEIMRSVDVPVLMLRAIEEKPQPAAEPLVFRRVLIPLDRTPRAERIIHAALNVAGNDATYVLACAVSPVPVMANYADACGAVSVVADPEATDRSAADAKDYLLKVARRMGSGGSPTVEESIAVSEYTGPTLSAAARSHHVDLVALATHGRGASRVVFGSVADDLLRGTSLPILVCHREQD